MEGDRLSIVLSALLPGKMAEALDADDNPQFIAEMLGRYLLADEDSKADIIAFFDSDGPAILEDVHVRETTATPTAEELSEWPSLDDPTEYPAS